jgi:signal transduction histidine kinase
MISFFLKLPIRIKFALGSITILVVVSIFLLTYFQREQEHQALALVQSKVQNTSEMVALAVGIALNSNNFQAVHEALIWARQDANLSYILVEDNSGNDLANINKNNLSEDVREKITATGVVKIGKIMNAAIDIRFANYKYGKLILGYSLANVYQKIYDNLLKGILICLVILFFAVVLTLYFSNIITCHIRILRDAAYDFTKGKEDARVQINSTDEIGELSLAFNHMIETIQNNFKSLKRANLLLASEVSERKQAEDELRFSREQLRNLSNRLQSVREEEKSYIAREIHDELGQSLTALSMDLAWLEKKIPERDEAVVKKIESMELFIQNTVQTIHQIITELRPQILDVMGIMEALKWQTREFQKRTGIHCEIFSTQEEIDLDPDRSITLFRIYQESLTNVARHAEAKKVTSHFQVFPDRLELEVRDDGKGIPEDKVFSETSFGLLGMRERVLLWGGQVKIMGSLGIGTTVQVSIPLNKI